MSYKTYTTEGLICGSTPSNTSDRSYLIFTKEAGMVWATAKSVREERSKQRYALQDFSHIRVSLVKGRSGWRIGSVESLGNAFLKAETRAERGKVTFIFTLLRRYVHGELPLDRIFEDTLSVLQGRVDGFVWECVQQTYALRLLCDLGYVPSRPPFTALIERTSLAEACALYDASMKKDIDKAIKAASEASHL